MAISDITKPMALDETLQATNGKMDSVITKLQGIIDALGLDTSVYKPKGNIACAQLVPALLIESNIGNVYNVTDNGTTTSDFAEGAGKPIHVGDNVAIVDIGTGGQSEYKFDLLAGMVDLTNYVQKSATPGLLKNDGTVDDTPYTVVESSTTNGNIVIDDVETPVYRNYGNNTVLTTDKTPFLTRQTLNPTGFSSYVREKLIGCSVAWNQLVNGNFENYTKTSGSTITKSGDTYTFTKSGTQSIMYSKEANVVVPIGHKILIIFKGLTTSVYASLVRSNSNTTDLLINPDTPYLIHQVANNDVYGFGLYLNANLASSVSWKTYQCIDLTLAFGSTIADHLYSLTNNGGITKLRDMGCPIDKYTPYGYGLYSVKTSGKKIVGKNLFDGLYPNLDTTIRYRSIYLGIGTYTMSGTASTSGGCLWFFFEGQVTSGANNSTNGVGEGQSRTITTSDGYVTVAYRNNDNKNIKDYNAQIELGSTATTYEPYIGVTYPLGNDELRGKFDLVNGEIVASGDVKESNGEITRKYAAVNLGTLTDWSRNQGSDGNYRFRVVVPSAKLSGNYGQRNTLCSLYALDSRDDTVEPNNKEYILTGSMYSSSVFIVIRDDSYTDATTFKTAMNGVYLIYELANPTTVQSTPFADPMSLVGATTEEYIDTRDIPCPVGAERQYMGQSEDVVEIPSTPQSDGVWVQKCYVSGGKAHYVWELES